MYTSYIGKKFLKLYNEKMETSYSAKEFFLEKFFPLFFLNESHLLHVGNSPFFQKPKEVDVRTFGSKSLAQLENLKSAIAADEPNMSIYVGSQAKDVRGTTSGQVTEMPLCADEDEVYASWFGEALGIGVSGGFVMLIDEVEILWSLFQGWKYYRRFLEQTPSVKDKQIETWNGNWLWHWARPYYNPEFPDDNLQIETSEVQGNIAIPTLQWSKAVFLLTKKFPSKKIIAYAYNLSQTNTTLGFINLYLPEVNKYFELREKLFGNDDSILGEDEIETLATFYNFKEACKMGTIGLKALEPAKLREYIPKGSYLFAQGKDYKFNNEESYTKYQLYKTWIIAMLNKTKLLEMASGIAGAIIEFEQSDERGKKVFATLSQEIREAGNLKIFIDKLTSILNHHPTNADVFKEVVEQVLKMPYDNFPLFITLIRFEYAYKKSKNT